MLRPQVKVTQSMHPQDKVATGVLGRIIDVLKRGGGGTAAYRTGAYSLDGMVKMLEGEAAPVARNEMRAVRGAGRTLTGLPRARSSAHLCINVLCSSSRASSGAIHSVCRSESESSVHTSITSAARTIWSSETQK